MNDLEPGDAYVPAWPLLVLFVVAVVAVALVLT